MLALRSFTTAVTLPSGYRYIINHLADRLSGERNVDQDNEVHQHVQISDVGSRIS